MKLSEVTAVKIDEKDPKFVQLTKDIGKVWQAIGHECEEYCNKRDEKLEMCLDADRLELTAHAKESNDYYHMLTKTCGYKAVEKALLKHFHY